MNRMAAFETHSSIEQMTLAKLHTESDNYLANIFTDVRDAVRAHVDMMNMHLGIDFSDDKVKDLVRPVLNETVHDLLRELKKDEHKAHKASYKGTLRWYTKEKFSHKEKRMMQESIDEEINEYVKQAIEYLVNRQLSIICLQIIPERIDCQQMLEELNVSNEKKIECKSAFDSLPKFYVVRGEGSSTEKIQEQFTEVHRKKLLLGLEENSEKRNEFNEELIALSKKMEDEREGYRKKIRELTYSLTHTVRAFVPKYVESKTERQLGEIMKSRYEDAARQLSGEVAEQLPEDAKIYFSEDRIGAAIKMYTEIHHRILKKLALYFDTVFEESKEEMKICGIS